MAAARSAPPSADSTRLENDLRAARRQIDELMGKLSERDQRLREVEDDAERKTQKLEARIAELESRGGDEVHQKGRIRELEAAITAYEGNLRRLEEQLDDKADEIESLERQLAKARTQSIPPPPDDLRKIKGIGPSFERALHAMGVTSYEQIAEWSDEDVERIAEKVNTTAKRIQRDGWVKSARAKLAVKRQRSG